MAKYVEGALLIPEIAELRPEFVSESPIYGLAEKDETECVTIGIVDAMTIDNRGQPNVVIDWKSDVSPAASTTERYCSQVGTYLAATGAKRGLIVLLTSGEIVEVLNVNGYKNKLRKVFSSLSPRQHKNSRPFRLNHTIPRR